jgi:hypothetical protein
MKASVTLTLENVDWEMLRNQKLTLVGLSGDGALTKNEADALDGVINFLDHVQDQGAKILGEETVFGK